MGLLRRIKQDYIDARKQRNPNSRVLSSLHNAASAVGRMKGNRETKDDEVLVVINEMIDSNKKLLSRGLANSARKDALREIDLLKGYLPKMLSNDELEAILEDLVSGLPVRDIEEKSRVVRKLEEYYLGRYDQDYADQIVTGLLSK